MCRDRDSNPDGPSTAQRILSPLRLPIPPSRQNRTRANRQESYATTGRCPTRESSPRRHRASIPVRTVPARLRPGTIRGIVRSRLAQGWARTDASGPEAQLRSDAGPGVRDRGAVHSAFRLVETGRLAPGWMFDLELQPGSGYTLPFPIPAPARNRVWPLPGRDSRPTGSSEQPLRRPFRIIENHLTQG